MDGLPCPDGGTAGLRAPVGRRRRHQPHAPRPPAAGAHRVHQALARAWALTAGAALALGAFSVLGLTVLNHLHPAEHGHHSLRGAVIMFAAGALMAALAARSLLRRPTPAEQHETRTTGRLDDAPTYWFVGVGAIGMTVNFSTLVLFLPALPEITRSSVAVVGKGIALAILFVVTLSPVLIPVGLVTVSGGRAEPLLDTLHALVARHSRQIGIAVEVVFAGYLVWKGFAELP